MPVFARDGSAFQKIMHRIRLVAATDISVMIFGENGTGKEHIAHHLHDKSKRAGKPFLAVDSGSLTKRTCAVSILRTRQRGIHGYGPCQERIFP